VWYIDGPQGLRRRGKMPPAMLDLGSASTDVAEVVPGLFIGGTTAARHLPDGVRSVVNATEHEPCHHADDDVRYLRLHIEDTENAAISEHFAESNAFIANGLEAGESVLVHCIAGISRSAALIIAYLVGKRGHTLAEALELTRTAREVAKPNKGFLVQLEQYAAGLAHTRAAGGATASSSSVAQTPTRAS